MENTLRHSEEAFAATTMGPFITILLPVIFAFAAGFPADLLKDTDLVGSNVDKVYSPAPFDDLQLAGSGDESHGQREAGHEGENNGYYTSKSAKKDNGYKHFDSFHKKGGDNYGYEAHSSYGKTSGGNKGGNHKTSASYHDSDGDGRSDEGYYQKHGASKGKKDHKGEATDGDFHYSNYEADGEGDSEHFSEEGDHYDEDGGHYSEGYTDDESSEGSYYDGEGESGGYYDGEGETKQKSVIHHGGPTGATSYSVRHY